MEAKKSLKELRESLGLTLDQVSSRSFFTKSFLSQIENGEVGVNVREALRIADALQISLELLASALNETYARKQGAIRLIGEAYETEYQIVIVGAVPDGMEHSCDAMGCGSTGGHVLYRFTKPG